jgi:hypothetical protein
MVESKSQIRKRGEGKKKGGGRGKKKNKEKFFFSFSFSFLPPSLSFPTPFYLEKLLRRRREPPNKIKNLPELNHGNSTKNCFEEKKKRKRVIPFFFF